MNFIKKSYPGHFFFLIILFWSFGNLEQQQQIDKNLYEIYVFNILLYTYMKYMTTYIFTLL